MNRMLFACLVTLALAVPQVSADTWYVCPDGTGDATTIQGGIGLASPGDEVCVRPGIYSPSANGEVFPIVMGNGVALRSCPLDWDQVTIDAEGTARVFNCVDLDQLAVIQGFTITGGDAGSSVGDLGGGIYSANSLLEIRNCKIVGNHAQGGGAICAYYSPVDVVSCSLRYNSAEDHGGGMHAVGDIAIRHCTVSHNTAQTGGGIYCSQDYTFDIERCIIWKNEARDYAGGIRVNNAATAHITSCTICENTAPSGGGGGVAVRKAGSSAILLNSIVSHSVLGEAVQCDQDGTASVDCCDMYANAGGDYVGCIAGREDVDGNISASPCYRVAEFGDFHICETSPCRPEISSCGLIGAWGLGCEFGPTSTSPTY